MKEDPPHQGTTGAREVLSPETPRARVTWRHRGALAAPESAGERSPELSESGSPLRVLLVEGGLELATRLKGDLASQEHVSIELTSSQSLRWSVERLQGERRAGVLLVELALLGDQAEDTISELRSALPQVPVIVLTDSEDEAWALPSIRKGEQAYLIKSECSPRPLARLLRAMIERQRAEEALRRSERRCQQLIDSTTDYVYRVTLDHERPSTTRYSGSSLAVTGYAAEELAADPDLWFRMIHEQDRPAVAAQIERILEGFSPPPLEHRILHKDGALRWIRNAPVLHKGVDGRLLAYEGLVSDITERKRAEQLLRVQHGATCALATASTLNEALLRVMQVVCEGFQWDLADFWSYDPVAKRLRCSAVWRSASPGLAEFEAKTQAFTYVPGMGLPGRVWLSGEPVWIADVTCDADFHRASLAKQLGLRAGCAFPVRNGEPLGVFELFSQQVQQLDPQMMQLLTVLGSQIGQFVDRRRAENALRQSEERLALVIRGSNDGIWDWNVVTDEVYFSPRWKAMLGYEDGAIGATFSAWEQLLHPEDHDRAVAQVQAYFAGETQNYQLEHRLRHKDGSYRWILARGVALRDREGKPVRMAGSHVDLTEQKRIELQLREAYAEAAFAAGALKHTVAELEVSDRELKEAQLQLIQAAKLESIGTLAAGVAHEVKNPLQTILMGLDFFARRTPAEDANGGLALGEMRDAVKRANRIVGELLQLSVAAEVSLKSEDWNVIVEMAMSLVQYEARASKITVVRQLSAHLPPVCLDRSKMEQVFVNLLLNAFQATPQGGTVTVRTRAELWSKGAWRNERWGGKIDSGDAVVVTEIQDSGGGIPEEHLARVFDPFFSTRTSDGGTGLGLSIVRSIIDLHGGIIHLENVAAGGVRATLILKTQPRQDPETIPGGVVPSGGHDPFLLGRSAELSAAHER